MTTVHLVSYITVDNCSCALSQTVRRKTMDKLTTQGNFYPMPSYMFLQDTTSRVTLLTGQPLGVSSRETGMSPSSLSS